MNARGRAAAALAAMLGGGVAACDVPVETTATAHESPPFDAPWGIDAPPMASLYVSSYLGGGATDDVEALAVGGVQYPYVVAVGGTASSDFPTTDGTLVDTTATAGCSACPSDAFVVKRRNASEVAWSTVIGGPGFERATAVALAADGDVFVGGSAASLPESTLTAAADATFAGGSTAERGEEDGFVCRLDGATGATEWCTFVGGNGSGGVQALVADLGTNTVLVALTTQASEALDGDAAYNAAFAGRHRSSAGGADTVVLRLAGDGQSFVWATYVGGTGDEGGTPSLARAPDGVHVLTTTSSSDAPTPGGLITTAPAGRNAYLATLASDAMSLRYGSYLGGAGDDWTPPNALDGGTVTYAAVNTTSADLPARNAAQATYGGGGSAGCGDGDGWIAALRPDLTGDASLVSATYLGGSRGDEVAGLARVGSGALVVAGRTYSSDFPLSTVVLPVQSQLRGSPCTTAPGNSDGFIVRYNVPGVDPALSQRDLATYVGGSAADSFVAAGAPGSGNFYLVGGQTASEDFPTTALNADMLGGTSDGVYVTTEWWAQQPVTPGDGGLLADASSTDAASADGGSAIDDGGGGCCSTSRGSPASSMLLALAVLAWVAGIARACPSSRRRRRALRATPSR